MGETRSGTAAAPIAMIETCLTLGPSPDTVTPVAATGSLQIVP